MDTLGTISHKLFVARAAATEDTLLDLTTKGNFAQKPATALDLLKDSIAWSPDTVRDASVRPIIKGGGIAFSFCGSTAADQNFLWYLKAWGNENSPCKYAAYGTGKLGTQAVVKYPHNNTAVANMFWADTLVVTAYNWQKPWKSTDTAGLNSVAEIWSDHCGFRYWLVEIKTTGATATAATTLATYYRRW